MTFDTGAVTTTISKELLFDLGYDVQTGNQVKIVTASGLEYVREVIIDKIDMGGFELRDVKVYAHSFPIESYSTGVIYRSLM